MDKKSFCEESLRYKIMFRERRGNRTKTKTDVKIEFPLFSRNLRLFRERESRAKILSGDFFEKFALFSKKKEKERKEGDS